MTLGVRSAAPTRILNPGFDNNALTGESHLRYTAEPVKPGLTIERDAVKAILGASASRSA